MEDRPYINNLINVAAERLLRCTSRPTAQRQRSRVIQNFLIVWLDENIDKDHNQYYVDAITKLQQLVNSVNTFIDSDECIDFVSDINEERVFMIIPDTLSQTLIPIIHDIVQIDAIYIFSENEVGWEQWQKKWYKVKIVSASIIIICEALKQASRSCDQNSISLSFVAPNDMATNKNLNQLDQSFMYSQILKEILLTIDFRQDHLKEFVAFCRELFIENTSELININRLEEKYHEHEPIWWYTSSFFLYSMVNRALRTVDVDIIIKMGFFIRDLHQQIVQLHAMQYLENRSSIPFTVYRGQGLSRADFDQLIKSKGGLISFNNFLSTSHDRDVSLLFAETNEFNSDLVGILFVITINQSVPSMAFANIRDVSDFPTEEEVLFSMHSVFRIEGIEQVSEDGRIYSVSLSLTTDEDHDLKILSNSIRQEIRGLTVWDRLGKLLIKLGRFDEAERLYKTLLNDASNDVEKAHFNHQLGYIKEDLGEYDAALDYYEKSLQIRQDILSANDLDFALYYNNIGSIYEKKGEHSTAIAFYRRASEIYVETSPEEQKPLATCYNNIGAAYCNMGKFSTALSYYEKALMIDQKTLPSNHPSLAVSYNNIGLTCDNMGKYPEALTCYEKTLEICEKILPPDHPDFAAVLSNIGSVYNSMKECSKAPSFHEKALKIRQKRLTTNHPDLAQSFNNIGLVYMNIDEHSKAISYYEKAIEIYRKSLPSMHPDLATCYSNIGLAYEKKEEYFEALSYYEKVLEIRQKTLPPDHSSIRIAFSKIGSLYKHSGEYLKAISYFEKAIEFGGKTLSSGHPDLVQLYKDMGEMYVAMGDNATAQTYFSRIPDTQQSS